MAIEDINEYKLVSIDELLAPKKPATAFILYPGAWWAVFEGQVLFYKGTSPQCNPNKAILERFMPSWCTAKYIERAYLPIRIHGSFDFDYAP